MKDLPFDFVASVFDGATPLQLARECLGLTPEEVAEASGIDVGTLGRYENGDGFPTPDEVIRLAAFLKVAPRDLDPSLEA